MTEDELLKAGISAVKSGNVMQAAALFAQAVRENPMSAQGWFLLGMSSSNTEQREYCLRRTLAINPNHQEAIKQMAKVSAASDLFGSSQTLTSAGNIKKTSSTFEHISNNEFDPSEKGRKRLSTSEMNAVVIKEIQERRRNGTFTDFIFAAGGGFMAAVITAIIWALFSYATMRHLAIMGAGLGMVVGFTVKIINRNGNFGSWILAGVLTLFGCLLGNYLVISVAIASGADVSILEVVMNLPFHPEIMPEALGFIMSTRNLMYYVIALVASLVTFSQ